MEGDGQEKGEVFDVWDALVIGGPIDGLEFKVDAHARSIRWKSPSLPVGVDMPGDERAMPARTYTYLLAREQPYDGRVRYRFDGLIGV